MGEDKGNLHILLHLSQKTGLHGSLKTSTTEISKEINVSQQTISRKLRVLENLGHIQREVSNNGISLRLTDTGRGLLEHKYLMLKSLFDNSPCMLMGKANSGLGEGRYYVSLDGYKSQFRERLGFEPYPGTLNLKVDKIQLKNFIMKLDKIIIKGFETKERTFGGIDCYNIKLDKNTPAALIIPHRTLHDNDTVEILSPVKLRDKFNIKDGDSLRIKNA